ncbi:Glycogen synthase [Cardinium endosymbiont of Culicoides punctatus]|nr:Glycogen synthase [Cardinium endosymbiont of Culicoides punctatus]
MFYTMLKSIFDIMPLQRILYIASEISPFLENSIVSSCVRNLLEAMQNKQIDVRVMVPKFGTIHNRVNRLHEVLRLSGSIVSIDDIGHTISVKVSSIPNTRLQVYFIDNESLFSGRRSVFNDNNNIFFEDNDIRMIFFCMGVMGTLKKLEWEADIVHCHDWITSLIPLFWKKLYSNNILFEKAKIITTIYNNTFSQHFPLLAAKIIKLGISDKDATLLSSGSLYDILKVAIQYSDVVLRGEVLDLELFNAVSDLKTPDLINNDDAYNDAHHKIYENMFQAGNAKTHLA